MAWLGLAATIAWNWHEHKHHRPTICSLTRRALPRPVFLATGVTGAVVLGVHVWRGYAR
jgi:hypothetical protein